MAFVLSTSSVGAAVRYVKAGASGTNIGTSWTNAYVELVSAINAAQSGDQIWIASGTYYPDFNTTTGTHTSDRTLRFAIKSNVSIFGGFAGNETSRSGRNWAANRTILSGDIGQPGVFTDNTRTIMATLNSTAVTGVVIEGVVFAGGNANDPAELGGGIVGGSGGAIHVEQGSVELRNCSFVGNYAVYGGAVFIHYVGSTLSIANCLFAGNTALYVGGAVNMQATSSPLTIRNSTIVNNTSSRGGAIGVNNGVSSFYYNNIIHSNSSTSTGWRLVEVGSGSGALSNNILEVALIPAGTNNLVVASPKLARYPSSGADGRWGTLDDVLDGRLAGDSPALDFGVAAQLPVDSTDMDGDLNLTEAVPFDLLHQSRELYSAPDAGAFEYVDLETVPPTLTSPVAGSRVKKPVAVSFLLPEAALSGSVELVFDNGTSQTTFVLAASMEGAGAHTLSFDPTDPVSTSGGAIASGTAFTDGVYSLTLSYRDVMGHAAAIGTNANVTIDNITLTPSLTAPASGVSTKSAVSISFNLPEAGQAGTLTLTFHDGITPRTLVLAGNQIGAGSHAFSFNPASPVSSSGGALSSGAAIPDGIYDVSLSYQDTVGNAAAASIVNTNVRIDTLTQAPSLTSPAPSSSTKSPINVAFTLPEQALSGSVKMGFSGTASRTLTLGTLMGTAGDHSFSFDPANPFLSAQVVAMSGGSSVPDGLYTTTLSYQDALGNAISSTSATSVRIDTTPPTLSLPSSVVVEATSPTGAVANYSAGATDSGTGVASSSFSPSSGSTFSVGSTTVNAIATDLVGNQSIRSFMVTVRDTTAPVIQAHTDVIVEATQSWGAVVTYAPGTATDAVGVASLTYSQASGTPFPLGTTTVTMFALDAATNLGVRNFAVTVRDTTPPLVIPPANVTVEATSPSGAVATFTNATASDVVGVTSLTYSQNSGTAFGIGTTTVTVTAKDAANNAGTATFTVTVNPLSVADTWRHTFFGAIGNSGDAADSATPDRDGIANLLKYGIVITPGTSGVGAMPKGEIRSYPEGNRLALVFTRAPARNDITIEVQATNDINGSWEPIAVSVSGLPFTGAGFVSEADATGGLKTVEIRDTMSMGATFPSRFMRIKVSRVPGN